METGSKMKSIVTSSARPLPVFLLLDISDSMKTDNKITTLNKAAQDMIEILKKDDGMRAEIHVSVITFGGEGGKLHQPLQPVKSLQWKDMTASGHTPMGEAFTIAADMIEDRSIVSSRGYRPVLALISDGQPNGGDWRSPLKRLLTAERAQKGDRFALSVGSDTDVNVLKDFVNKADGGGVFQADEATQIIEFIKFLTMSIGFRSKSVNPDDHAAGISTDLKQLG